MSYPLMLLKYNPVKVGDEGDMYEGQPDAVCHGCGAKYGEYHHQGCVVERCPTCGQQFITCDHAEQLKVLDLTSLGLKLYCAK